MKELKDTIEGMTSADYKERFIAEYEQVQIRLAKLADVLDKYEHDELDFELSSEPETLYDQANNMVSYIAALEERAEQEGIELPEYEVTF